MTHAEKGLAYARAVVAGEVVACQWVQLACARQLRDLEEFADGTRYVWSEEHADHVCDFIERLPHVKGPKARASHLADAGEGLLELEPWQCFVLAVAFGWRKPSGARRFGTVYIEVPRGNGKSALSSAVALYCLGMEGEQGGEIYSAATTRDQAKIVWAVAFDMLRKRPAFAARKGFKLPKTQQTSGAILHEESLSTFRPLSREAGNLDGLNPAFVCVDELHAHPSRFIWDVLATACQKRPSSLMWAITTAGEDEAGICIEQRDFTVAVLKGETRADGHFGIIYTLDDGDRWDDPASWRKANPNWAISVETDKFEEAAQKAKTVPSFRHTFKTKHLNLWLSTAKSWMEMPAYSRIEDPNLKEEDFRERSLYVGLDLATKVDIASRANVYVEQRRVWARGACEEHEQWGAWSCSKCYPEGAEFENHYFLFCEHFLPEAAVERSKTAAYRGWTDEGWFHVTPGDVTDFGTVREGILRDFERCQMREVAFDPWQASQLSQELDAAGVQMVEIRPSVATLSQPMKDFEALVLSGRLHTNGDPVLRWMVSNVVCIFDQKGNVYPRKPKNREDKKIDGVVAALMALNRASQDIDPYATGGFKSLGPARGTPARSPEPDDW